MNLKTTVKKFSRHGKNHLNVYHNITLIKNNAIQHKRRQFYVHNTPAIRNVLNELLEHGYIGNFIAVHEPFEFKKQFRLNKRGLKTCTKPQYLLVFNKWRMSNKKLPVIGGIEQNKRPIADKVPIKTSRMGVYRQGHGVSFIQTDKYKEHFITSHLARIRGIDGYQAFRSPFEIVEDVNLLEHKTSIDEIENNENILNDSEPIVVERISGWKLAKGLAGGAVGNFLEWFDFALFGLLADEIGEAFFPPGNSIVHLLEVFSIFAGSFLMRPLGGMLFGYLGDKYGRLFALRISLFMMAIPTFLTGILPTYKKLGIISTIILIILRLTQGVSVGGEITGALVYVLEICPLNRRSLFGILVQQSGSGIILASVVNAILRYILTESQMYKYGWRIPFIFGIVVVFFGIYIRRFLKNSNEFNHIKNHNKILNNPVKHIFYNNKLELLILVFHQSLSSIAYYTLFVWMPNYLKDENLRKNKDYTINNPYTINAISMALMFPTGILSGYLGDIYTPKKVIVIGGIIFIVSVIILFPILENTSNKILIGLITCLLSISFGCYNGAIHVFSVDIFYKNINTRYSGLGIGYNISVGLFGGMAPLIATGVVKIYNLFIYSWIIFIIGFNSLLFMYNKNYLIDKRDIYHKNKTNQNHKILQESETITNDETIINENETTNEIQMEKL